VSQSIGGELDQCGFFLLVVYLFQEASFEKHIQPAFRSALIEAREDESRLALFEQGFNLHSFFFLHNLHQQTVEVCSPVHFDFGLDFGLLGFEARLIYSNHLLSWRALVFVINLLLSLREQQISLGTRICAENRNPSGEFLPWRISCLLDRHVRLLQVLLVQLKVVVFRGPARRSQRDTLRQQRCRF